MARKWRELDPRVRKRIVIAGTIEGLLKIAALVDLRRRPASAVRGSKKWWALAIVLINSGGLVPITYFVRGRRR